MRAKRPLVLASFLCSALLACGGATTDGTDATGPGNGTPNGEAGRGSAGTGGSGIAGTSARGGANGSGNPGNSDDPTDPEDPPPNPGTTQCAALGGTWTGYIESFSVAGSDKITLLMAPTPDACVVGTARFGEGPLLAPATDPEVGYPAGVVSEAVRGAPVHTGFAYTLRASSLEGPRLRLAMDRGELWAGWCALQKPIASEGSFTGYGCLPNWGYQFDYSGKDCGQPNPKTGEFVPVECGKLALCAVSQFCECSANACATYADGALRLDVVVNGDKLDGSIVGVSPSVLNVHLSRQK